MCRAVSARLNGLLVTGKVQTKLSSANAELRTFPLRREPMATVWQL